MAKVQSCLVTHNDEKLCDYLAALEARVLFIEENGGGGGSPTDARLQDSSGNGHHLILKGDPPPEYGNSPFGAGGSWVFDGVDRDDDSVGLYAPAGIYSSGPLTVDVSFTRGNSNGKDQVLAAQWLNNIDDSSWIVGLRSNGVLYVGWRTVAGGFETLDALTAIQVGVNADASFTWDGTNWLIHQFGNHARTSPATTLRPPTAAMRMTIGRAEGTDFNTDAPNPFVGSISGLRFSNVDRWAALTGSDTSNNGNWSNDANTAALWNMDA